METLKNILYVEDDPDIAELVLISLQDMAGMDVKYCNSGQKALEQLKTYQPQLILMDVMMPEIDGPTTLKAIQQQEDLKDIPVVFMTARVQPQELDHYHKLGVINVIIKPFDPTSLAEQLQTCWESTQNRD